MTLPYQYGEAADWDVKPSLVVKGNYLDNVNLAPSGEEVSDFITEVNPEISINGDGSRFDIQFDYRMQNLLYSESSDANTTNHELFTNANVELLKQLLFFDLSGSYRQVLIDPEGRVGFDNISIDEDTTDQGTFSFSPYLTRRIGNIVYSELRYTHERVDYRDETDSSADSEVNRVFASFASSPFSQALAGGFSADNRIRYEGSNGIREDSPRDRVNRVPAEPFQWSLTYSRDNFDGEDGTSTRFEQALLDLTYLLGPDMALLGGIGYENNDFDSQNEATQNPQGLAWNIGAAWSPMRHTVLEARVGDRFFGNSYSFFLRHFTRRANATVEYREEFINPAGAALENRDLPIGSLIDLGTTPACGSGQLTGSPSVGIGTEVFFRQRLTVDLCGATAKSVFTVSSYNEQRDFQLSGNEEKVYGGEVSWDWQPSARTRSLFTIQWDRLNIVGENNKQNDWEVSLQLTRRIRPHIDGELEYRYLERDASEAEGDYQQNSIAASLKVEF